MLNEIYKQQYLHQTGQDATSKKRKREEAIETINTFIEECQKSQQYTREMKKRKNDIENNVRVRNGQLTLFAIYSRSLCWTLRMQSTTQH